MKYAVWLGLFAGCSFSHGVLATGGGTEDAQLDSPASLDDAMIDTPTTPKPDAMIDAPPAHVCPADYTMLNGGQSTSRYKLYGYAQSTSNVVDYNAAKTVCQNGGGYLAIPNNATEMSAFATVTQNPSQPGYWVGLTDAAAEGAWLTVLGDPAPYLPWMGQPNPQPNGGTAANCAVGDSQARLFDVDCAMATYTFVCECSL